MVPRLMRFARASSWQREGSEMAKLIKREQKEGGVVVITIEVTEQDLQSYPQYYGLSSERGR